MGRQALTMPMLGSIVDQMSASTAVPVGLQSWSERKTLCGIKTWWDREHTCWIVDVDLPHKAGADNA